MPKNKSLIYLLFFSITFLIWSCDDDFIESGAGFINSIELPPMYEVEHLKAYSDQIESVQTNSLQKYLIGSFNDPIFGKTKASLLTQVRLRQTTHNFGTDPEIDSVVLSLPLFSSALNEDEFRLDSIFGDGEVVFKVYESKKLLRDIDPGPEGDFQASQAYYSDQLEEFSGVIEDEPLAITEPFNPRDLDKLIVLEERRDSVNIDTLNLSPRIRIKLPNSFFQEKILNQIGTANLASNNAFVNSFRGLHIVAEEVNGNGAMIAFDIFVSEQNDRNAEIIMYYRSMRQRPNFDPENEDEPEMAETWNKFFLDLNGISVNFFDNSEGFTLPPQNIETGEEYFYIKGMQGIGGVIEIFSGPDSDGDGVPDELQELRERNVMVNEANLMLYLNENFATSEENRPQRIIVHDIKNNLVLLDYVTDGTTSSNPVTSRVNHLGPLTKDDNDRYSYRIRLTNYINDIINNDSTNLKIGVFVTENVNQSQRRFVRSSSEDVISRMIESSVTTPRGTVIHGSNSSDEDKKLKLRIQFTEIN